MTYEELLARNRAEYDRQKKVERRKTALKCAAHAVVLAVCVAVAIAVWNRYEARKAREAVLAAEEDRRAEEAERREAEARRVAAEEAARKREELERKLEEERLAREKQREEERRAFERKMEEERLAREKARQEREEKQAADRRRREEERKAAEQERSARKLAEERKRQEEKRAQAAQARLAREKEEARSRQAANRQTPAGKASRPAEKKNASDAKYQLEFFAARREMGGSVLEPLVRKLNGNIDDEEMTHTSARNARAVAMTEISGTIGPVEYSRQIKTKRTTTTQALGGFSGYVDGGVVSGTVYGPVTSIKEKVGGYAASVPAGFRKGFEKLMVIARRGHSRANAEAGACIFVEATKGQIGMDDRKALAMFAKAAELGDADGMFMQAFCLFYGIGRPSNSNKDVYEAYRILSDWQSLPDSQALRGSGWASRRLDEARQLGF